LIFALRLGVLFGLEPCFSLDCRILLGPGFCSFAGLGFRLQSLMLQAGEEFLQVLGLDCQSLGAGLLRIEALAAFSKQSSLAGLQLDPLTERLGEPGEVLLEPRLLIDGSGAKLIETDKLARK